jgi:hypothetical protein
VRNKRPNDRTTDQPTVTATAFEISEISENVASIEAVPRSLLPDGPARTTLLALASAGLDVYCYQSGGTLGTWCVWLEHDRYRIAEFVVLPQLWVPAYQALVAHQNNPDENGGAE